MYKGDIYMSKNSYLIRELGINGYQTYVGGKGTFIGDFFQAIIKESWISGYDLKNNLPFLMSQVYTYGVIQGKRQERARRKSKAKPENYTGGPI